MRLRVAAAVVLVVVACSGNLPVELRTAADASAVVPVDLPRPGERPTPTTTTTAAPTTTTAPPAPTTTTEAPVELHEPPAPSPAPPVAASSDCLGWADTIARHFPAEQRATACRVMVCETGGTGDPTIHNPSSTASGLWQFLDSTWERTTGTPAPAANYSADTQTAAAAELWSTSGWGPWSCA